MAIADWVVLVLALVVSGIGALLVVAWATLRMINPEDDL